MLEKQNTVVIVQARMGSTRLPGKVLLELDSRTVLEQVVSKLQRAKTPDQIVLAIPNSKNDDLLAEFIEEKGWLLSRGSENDLLDRYYQTAKLFAADTVVRITSDCPLIDADLLDENILTFKKLSEVDYLSNTLEPRTYPRGLDIEVMSFDALERAWREDPHPQTREHVTPYIRNNPRLFKLFRTAHSIDLSEHRWTLDTPKDYELLCKIFDHFGDRDSSWHEVLKLLDLHPQWATINRDVEQKKMWVPKTETVVNSYGFHQLANPPSFQQLEEYYGQKYYQENKGAYAASYTDAELSYFRLKVEQKWQVIQPQLTASRKPLRLLDLGCGEGWTMAFFRELGWETQGVDYSSYALEKYNPQLIDSVQCGNIEHWLKVCAQTEDTYDVIWLDNVLEHMLDPRQTLELCRSVCAQGGLLIVEVPNDFSALQLRAMERKWIDEPFWILAPDHISYFNRDGLQALAKAVGWRMQDCLADFPIDWALSNPNTNYCRDKSKGRSVHLARVELELLLNDLSKEKTTELMRVLASMGLGRQIIAVFKREETETYDHGRVSSEYDPHLGYCCWKEGRISQGEYTLLSVRPEDILEIMRWRNTQLNVLRQKQAQTAQGQRDYFARFVWPELKSDQPSQILFSIFHLDTLIAYGALVHIDWSDRRAEISFLANPEVASDQQRYQELFLAYLTMVKQVAFTQLGLKRLWTETYDIRPIHIKCLEDAGLKLEGRMRECVIIDGKRVDSLIHGVLLGDE